MLSVGYLGKEIASSTEELRCRITSCKSVYGKLKTLLTINKINLQLGKDVFAKCVVLLKKKEGKVPEKFWEVVVEKNASSVMSR